jgi:hypothetical protein
MREEAAGDKLYTRLAATGGSERPERRHKRCGRRAELLLVEEATAGEWRVKGRLFSAALARHEHPDGA